MRGTVLTMDLRILNSVGRPSVYCSFRSVGCAVTGAQKAAYNRGTASPSVYPRISVTVHSTDPNVYLRMSVTATTHNISAATQ